MEKNRKNKFIALTALAIAIMSITIAFAALSATLTINGTARMNTANWDVHFITTSLSSTTTGGAIIETAPTLTTTGLGNFNIILTAPTDGVSYTFDVRNAGTIDARIGALTQNGNNVTGTMTPVCTGLATDPIDAAADAALVCANLTYTLIYTDGGALVSLNDTLNVGQTRNLTLTLSFGGTNLPTDDVEITGLGIVITYIQN